MTTNRGRRSLRILALLLSVSLIAAACGDDDDADTTADQTDGDNSATDSTDGDMSDDDMSDDDMSDDDMTDDETVVDDTPLTASFRGVSETTITVGVTMLDFQDLVDTGLSPAGWGDQQAVFQALIDNVNANGGVNGRMIEPVYDFYTPVSADDASRACFAVTEDAETFAVLGGFVGPLAGTADPCITGINDTILIGGDQNAEELSQATAPWYQPGANADASTEILLNLLEQDGRLDGASVFVMGGAADEANHDATIAALEDRGIEVAGDGIILAPDGDVAGQDTELEVLTARVAESNATAVFIHGTPSASIRGLAAAGLHTELDLWTNNAAGLNNLGSVIPDRALANGVLTSTGPDDTSIWEDPTYQSECNEVVAAAGIEGADLREPNSYLEDEENWFNSVRRYCRHLDLFVQIATAAGNELTHDSFRAGAETLTDFALPGSPNTSLSADKLYAEDGYALAEYDSTAGDGMAVPLGPIVDAFQ